MWNGLARFLSDSELFCIKTLSRSISYHLGISPGNNKWSSPQPTQFIHYILVTSFLVWGSAERTEKTVNPREIMNICGMLIGPCRIWKLSRQKEGKNTDQNLFLSPGFILFKMKKLASIVNTVNHSTFGLRRNFHIQHKTRNMVKASTFPRSRNFKNYPSEINRNSEALLFT